MTEALSLLPQSKYLEAFQEVKKLKRSYELVGDILIVEEIDLGDGKKTIKRADGTVAELVTSSGGAKRTDGLEMNKPVFCRVLAVGEGYYDEETLDDVKLESKEGDIILVGRMSVSWFSVFGTLVSEAGKQIGIVRENEIRLRWKGEKAYNAYFEALNKALAP